MKIFTVVNTALNPTYNFYRWKSHSGLVTYKSQSTAMMRVTSSAGRPTALSTITMVTSPAWGTPAAPTLAAVAVTLHPKQDNHKTLHMFLLPFTEILPEVLKEGCLKMSLVVPSHAYVLLLVLLFITL